MPSKPPTFRPFGKTTKQVRAEHDRQRGSAAKRGYGSAWRRYRERFLSLADNVLCACGCGEPSQCVDHIDPVDGPDDPLFWDEANHQGMTNRCHSRKTRSDNVWMGTASEYERRRAARGGG